MTVSAGRLGLAGLAAPPRAAPTPPPILADVDDLPRYLRDTALLAEADKLDAAYAACQVAAVAAAGWDAPGVLARIYSLRGALSRRMGNLPDAARDGWIAAKLLAASDADPSGEVAALLVARRIAVLLDIGDVADADALLTDFGTEPPGGPGALAFRYVRGRLHAAAGRPGEALADLFGCGERLAVRRADHPAVLSWRSSAAAILAEIGTRESATRLVEAEVALCRQANPASAMSRPSALGRALRVQGRVLGAPAGIPASEEAVRVLERSPRRFEYAQALVGCGELLNAARRKPPARRMLREGLALAERCGSPALTERARAAYAAAGGKVRLPPPDQAPANSVAP